MRLESHGHRRQEALKDAVDVVADNRVFGAGHSDVTDECSAVGQDACIDGSNMSVRAQHGAHAPVKVPSHCDLLARRLGMNIHDHDGAG